MDRAIIYPQAQAAETDLLSTNRNVLIALGLMLQDLLGTSTVVAGCAITAGTGLTVSVAPGRIYSLQNVDNTAYSTLGVDTALQVMKQGILSATAVLNCPAPTTSGDSINYLIEASYEDIDAAPIVLSYYNSSNPTQPFAGPNNNGQAQYTVRQGQLIVQAKAGAQATTGTQTTPAADAGFVGIGVVTVAFGAGSIVTGNITAYAGAPIMNLALGQAPVAGWGTPTGASVVSNFPGASATLVQCSEVLAELITIMKARGTLAA